MCSFIYSLKNHGFKEHLSMSRNICNKILKKNVELYLILSEVLLFITSSICMPLEVQINLDKKRPQGRRTNNKSHQMY